MSVLMCHRPMEIITILCVCVFARMWSNYERCGEEIYGRFLYPSIPRKIDDDGWIIRNGEIRKFNFIFPLSCRRTWIRFVVYSLSMSMPFATKNKWIFLCLCSVNFYDRVNFFFFYFFFFSFFTANTKYHITDMHWTRFVGHRPFEFEYFFLFFFSFSVPLRIL